MQGPTERAAGRPGRRFVVIALLIGLLALSLRLLFILLAQVDQPVYGDGFQYMAYAWNLVHHGVFSCSLPGSEFVAKDAYRGPGYPLLLAAALQLAGDDSDRAIRYVQIAQALMGAATVWITIALARLCVSRRSALVTGLVVACWPHLVTFAGTLMSETLFGLLLVAAIWIACLGERRKSWQLTAVSGLIFGGAYLVNATILILPLIIALVLVRRRAFGLAAILAAAAVLAPAGWGWRNASLPADATQFHHAVDAFVWGSSPIYVLAFNSRWVSAEAKSIVEYEKQETQTLLADPVAGLAIMLERMRQDPLAYATWYLVEKPFALWDWAIVIGNGDIYYPATMRSPFERIFVLRLMKQLLQWFNPVLFALSLISALCLGWISLSRPADAAFAAVVCAWLMLYVTGLHAVFQSEPRYSIPYRPEQLLLAAVALGAIGDRLLRGYRKSASAAASSRLGADSAARGH